MISMTSKSRAGIISLAAAAALAVPAMGASAASGPSSVPYDPPVCTPHAVIETSHGQYNVDNSVFGADDQQCLSVRAGGHVPAFKVVRSTADASYPVQASPFVYTGCFYGRCTHGSGYPVWLPHIRSLTATWQTHLSPAAGSVWDAGFDLWLNKTSSVAGHADGAEVMIWPDSDLSARASQLTEVDGRAWHLWDHITCNSGLCWPLIIFRAARPAWKLDHLHLGAFFRAADRLTPFYVGHYFLEATLACFEIWRGGTGLQTTWFTSKLVKK
jgi:Glycosyl hydrolase family 12